MREPPAPIGMPVTELGSGPPLVLLPGGPGLQNYLRPLAELLASHARVILPDLRGTGGSNAVPPYEILAFIGELELLRQQLGLATWTVGGHSFGADLALAYGLEQSSCVNGLISISGTGVQDDRSWHAAYEKGRAEGRDPGHAEGTPFDEDVHEAGLASWRAYIKVPDLLRRIAALPMPVHAIYGSEDVRPRWAMEQVVQLVKDGRMEVIEGAGHWPWVTHPQQTAVSISKFLIDMGTDGRLVGLDHVQLAMPAGGEDRARAFYADLLGLREVTKPDRLASRGGCWFVGSELHLHLGIAPDFQPATKAHPGLVVADLAGLRSRLLAAGVEVTDDDSVPSVRRFYAGDPFGNRLEFIDERHAGFTDSP